MARTTLAIAALLTASSLISSSANAQWIGDPPYWPNQYEVPIILSQGCWLWNWQQRSWYDRCWWPDVPHHVRSPYYRWRRGTSSARH